MPDASYVLAALLVGFVVTFGLRALPFVVIGPLRRSRAIRHLGLQMPAGVMVILTVYTLHEVPVRAWPHALPEAVALTITIVVHLWRRSALAGIVAGTATYMALVTWVVDVSAATT